LCLPLPPSESYEVGIDHQAHAIQGVIRRYLFFRENVAAQGGLQRGISPPAPEQQLRILTQSLALVHGRIDVTAHDMELVKRVVFSTISAD